MRKCNNCNIEMLEGKLFGKPRFMDMDHDIDKFYFNVKTGENTNFLGIKYDETKQINLNACVCPKCGKVDLYVNPDDLKQ